jgi:MFS-type transporter involved in bile tolerance (Atg22 family)
MEQKQRDQLNQIRDIGQQLQEVVKNTLGTEFITGECTPAERATKIATAMAAGTYLIQKLTTLAIIMRLERAPTDPEKAAAFVASTVKELTETLQERMAHVVDESMSDIAFAMMAPDENTTTQ